MIFITTGTQFFKFERLINEIINIAKSNPDVDYVIQYPYSDIFSNPIPSNVNMINSMTSEIFLNFLKEADIVITHAGTASIIKCEKLQKKYIVIPRLKKFHEHIDDHQLEISEVFEDKGNAVVVRNIKSLENEIEKISRDENPRIKLSFSNTDILDSITNVIKLL